MRCAYMHVGVVYGLYDDPEYGEDAARERRQGGGGHRNRSAHHATLPPLIGKMGAELSWRFTGRRCRPTPGTGASPVRTWEHTLQSFPEGRTPLRRAPLAGERAMGATLPFAWVKWRLHSRSWAPFRESEPRRPLASPDGSGVSAKSRCPPGKRRARGGHSGSDLRVPPRGLHS